MILEESASRRTQQRMDSLVCCNTSGKPGGGLFRDKVIEIVVRSVKTKLRHLHTSMKDSVIDKAIASLSTISRIVDHDLLSMGFEDIGLQTSYNYIGEEAEHFLKEKIKEIDPFSSSRLKVKLIDKSRGLSPFTGMSKERLDKFVTTSKRNYNRNHPSNPIDNNSP